MVPVYIILLLVLLNPVHAQQRVIGIDTSAKYKNVIRQLVSQQATELLDKIQDDPLLFEAIITPCRENGKLRQNGRTDMVNNFFIQLVQQLSSYIQDIYKRDQNYKYFGKKNLTTVVEDAREEADRVKKEGPGVPNTGSTERFLRRSPNKIITELVRICGSNINPQPKNTPPDAEAGPPITITEGKTLTLDASRSTDKEKNIISYRWQKQTGGGPPFNSPPSSSPRTDVTGLTPGTYTYLLEVMDSYKETGRDTLTVTVVRQVIPPTADAGGPYTLTWQENKVRLIGKGGGPPAKELSFTWSLQGEEQNVRILSRNNEQTDVEGLKPGVYRFLLTVKSKEGLSATDIAVVTVALPPTPENNKPVVEAGKPVTITLPVNTVSLKGTVKDKDNDPFTVNWSYYPAGLTAVIIDRTKVRTKVNGLEAGVYNFVLTANDGRNGIASDTVVITVEKGIDEPAGPKKPPTAFAGEDQNAAPGSIHLHGSGKDEDGRIVAYQWKWISGKGRYQITDSTDMGTTVEIKDDGEYVFELRVMDNDGLEGKDTVLISIHQRGIPAWVRIIIGMVILGGTTTGYYFFLWGRRRKKLIVYFMNPEEEALAHELMPGHKKTDGYILGHATQAKIKKMKKKGLALRVLNTTVLTVHTPGATRTYKYSIKKEAHELVSVTHESPGYNYVNIITDENVVAINNNMAVPAGAAATPHEHELPAFYIITLDGPLLPVFSEQLEAIGLPVLQRVPFDSYIIKIKDWQQLETIQQDENFRFIRMIKQYTAEDTGFTVRKDHFDNVGTPGTDNMLTMDLVLHSEDDAPLVRDFLGSQGIERIASYRNTIRVRVPAGNDIAYTLSSNKYIQAIYEHIPPVMHNDVARQLINIDIPGQEVAALEENGTGEIIAVADTGIDKQHPDFSSTAIEAVAWGRKATGDTSDPHGHGTHVTGTIIGNGAASQGQIKGIAPGATVFFQSLLDENEELCDLELQLPELLQQAYEKGARILNISWGSATESYYTFDSAMIDQFMYDKQEMLVIVSAGNDAANKKDKNGNPLPGFGTVGSPATTKNGLTVGASNSKRDNGDAESLAVFSSRGPCRPERRIKPDIVAPGTNILSAKSSTAPDRNFDSFYSNSAYVFLAGTSMATPIVSGAAAMVREYYKKKRDHLKPGAALIKATLLNGTRRLSGASAMLGSEMIPNNNQGYGMLDMKMTLPNKEADFKLWFCDSLTDKLLPFNKAGERRMFRLELQQNSWLRICMVFMDNPRMNVQSDLNLLISLEGTITKWKGNAGINIKDEFFSDKEEDFTNNIEIVRIEDAAPGSYLIEAVADNVAPAGNVGFAIVVTTGDNTSQFSTVQL